MRRSNVKNRASDYSVVIVVVESVFPYGFDLPFLLLISDIDFADFPLPQLDAAVHVELEFVEVFGPEAEDSPDNVMFVILMLVYSYDAVVETGDFEVLFEFELEHFKFEVKFLEMEVVRVIVDDLYKGAVETVEHEPEVREVVAFMLALGKHRPEIPI